MSCDSTQLSYLYFYAGVCWSLGDAHCELQEVSMGAMLMPTCSCSLFQQVYSVCMKQLSFHTRHSKSGNEGRASLVGV